MESLLRRCWGRNLRAVHFLKSSGLLLLLTLLSTIIFAQTFNCPNASRCTSKDLSIVGAFLTGGACQCSSTGTQTAALNMTIDNTTGSQRTSFAFFGTLVQTDPNGTRHTTPLSGCGGPLPPNVQTTIIVNSSITYNCNQTLSLENVYLAWTDASGTTGPRCADILADACVHISPKCGTAPVIPINPLLSLSTTNTDGCTGRSQGQIKITPIGGKPKYSVQLKQGGVTVAGPQNNVTSTGYTFTGLAEGIYDAVVTDSTGCVYTKKDTLGSHFCCTPPTINGNPSNDTKCAGGSSSFTASSTGGDPAPTVQWQVSTDGGTTWADLANGSPYSGVTNTTLIVNPVSTGLTGNQYRAVFTSGSCTPASTTGATLTVNATTVAGTVGVAQTICYNTSPNDLTLTGKTGNVVKWQKSTDNFVLNSTDIANTTTTLSPGALTQDTWFRAVVQSGVCPSATSNAVKITVDAATVAGTVAAAQTICSGSSPNSLTLSGNTGTVVKWQKSTDNFVSNVTDIANTTTTLSPGTLTQDTWYRAVVQNGVCASANSNSVKITVRAIPGKPDFSITQPSLCGPSTGTLTICQSVSGFDYTVGGITKGGTGSALSFTGLAAGSNPTLVVAYTGGACPSASFTCTDATTCTSSTTRAVSGTSESITESQPSVKAYPNPFTDKINFVVTTPVSGKGSLDVYNMMGQKVRTIYQGFISAGTQTFQMSSQRQQVANLIYVLRIGDKKITGRILQINQ